MVNSRVDIPVDSVYSSNNPFSLTRQEASDQLEVSLRTLDRYLKKGKIQYVRTGLASNTIRISRTSLYNFLQIRNGQTPAGTMSLPETTPHFQKRRIGAKKSSTKDSEIPVGESPLAIYRRLYEEASQKLDDASKRLEGANYRVGELESQLKNTVPLLEYRETEQKIYTLGKKVEILNEEIKESATANYKLVRQISHTKDTLRSERYKKFLYILLLVLIIASITILFSSNYLSVTW